MLTVRTEGRFKKDAKKLSKSGSKDMLKLKEVIRKLEREEPLEKEYKPHPLFDITFLTYAFLLFKRPPTV